MVCYYMYGTILNYCIVLISVVQGRHEISFKTAVQLLNIERFLPLLFTIAQ